MVGNITRVNNIVIVVNLSKKIAQKLNAIPQENIRKLHIFVTDTKNVDPSALIAFGKWANKTKTPCIVHCQNRDVRKEILKIAKDVPRGKWFHTSLREASDTERSFSVRRGGATIVAKYAIDHLYLLLIGEKETSKTVFFIPKNRQE